MAERDDVRGAVLEGRLSRLGEELDYPLMSSTSAAVGRRLRATSPGPAARPWRERLPWRPELRPVWTPAWQRVALVLVAVILAVGGLLAISPAAREAVAALLGLGGVEIRQVERLPPATAPGDLRSHLGRRVSLEEARSLVPWQILLPAPGGLGQPDEVYLDARYPAGVVSLLYLARPGLPSAPTAQVGLLLTEFRGSLSPGVTVQKLLDGGATVQGTRVETDAGSLPALWISGRPHEVMLLDERGEYVPDTLRLEGDVLLWAQGELTLRIESALGREQAVGIAESLR